MDVSDFTSDAMPDHTAGVANGVNSITISATPNHSGAIVVIKTGAMLANPDDNADMIGGTVDADGTVGLNVPTVGNPNNIIAVEVTAENGVAIG